MIPKLKKWYKNLVFKDIYILGVNKDNNWEIMGCYLKLSTSLKILDELNSDDYFVVKFKENELMPYETVKKNHYRKMNNAIALFDKENKIIKMFPSTKKELK